jgi:hypothetical protein
MLICLFLETTPLQEPSESTGTQYIEMIMSSTPPEPDHISVRIRFWPQTYGGIRDFCCRHTQHTLNLINYLLHNIVCLMHGENTPRNIISLMIPRNNQNPQNSQGIK